MPNRSYTYSLPEELPTDPILLDLIPEFVSQWMRDFTVTWPEIKGRGDTEEFKRFGHTIKGSFLQFGFRDLSAVGKQIMTDAEDSDWDEAEARIKGLITALEVLGKRT